MFIIEWFNSMSLVSQIFCCIALPATILLLIQTLFMFIGGSDNGDGIEGSVGEVTDEIPDGNGIDGVFGENEISEAPDEVGLDGLKIFTVRGIIAFFVVFGWMGVILDGANAKLYVTIPVAAVCGFAMMLVLAVIFKLVMKLRNDGNIDNRNAVGVAGKVQLTVPAARSGEGKVHLMLQGSYVERDAVTDDEEPIPTGSEIVVVGVSGQTTLIVKRK